jgi:hypothetical protein
VHHITAQRGGNSYDKDEKLLTFTDGKISRLDEEHPDLAEFDAFWA